MCFLFHKWGKWEVKTFLISKLFDSTPIEVLRQQRTCKKCCFIQVESLVE